MVFRRKVSDRKYKNGPAERPKITADPMVNWDRERQTLPCSCCSTIRGAEEFPEIYSSDFYYKDKSGRKRAQYCMYCITHMCEAFEQKYNSKFKALYRMCAELGIYYDDKTAHKIFEEEHTYEDGTPVSAYIPRYELYFRAVRDNEVLFEKEFMDSWCVPFETILEIQDGKVPASEGTEQCKRDRNDIIEKFHYDPFDKEPIADRARLYSDLLTLYDDAMASDLVRQRAAIEIVKSFYRIDCIGQTIQELQANTRSMVDNSKVLKELIDQKKKETDMVTSFSKDHGFAERYQMARSKGTGTLSSVVRDGYDNHFDRLAVNKFDIATAEAMKQVANISSEAMIHQIQLTGDEFRNMIEEQAIEIRKLTEKVGNLTEANRLLREKVVKNELIEEYRKDLERKGIVDEEVIGTAIKNAAPPTYYSNEEESAQ